VNLSPPELRVLGCLVEKQLTTPQQYPLTLNALALACNQSSNRDPVVDYDERTVEEAVTSVKTRGLARFVHPSHGRSALRFGHCLDEVLGLGVRPLALLAVLMVRGAQTPGELRARTERMAPFSDLREVQAELDSLARREEPLVVRLARVPGQKEDRYAQLLGAARDRGVGLAMSAPAVDAHLDASGGRGDPPADERRDRASLAAEVDSLRAEVDSLRRDLDDLRAQLGT
jgi:uncharacterized protein YceH (UPF0502 family)